MKFTKKLALLLALMMTVSGSCIAETAVEATEVPETAETTTTAEAVDEVLATVNGTPITQSTVDEIVDYYYSNYSSYGYTEDFFKPISLNYAIEDALIRAKMDELEIVLTAEEQAEAEQSAVTEYNEQLDYYTGLYGSYYFGITEESTEEEIAVVREYVAALMESSGMSVAAITENAVYNARYEKLSALMGADVVITEEQVKASYDEKVAEDMEACQPDEDGTYAYYEYMALYYGEEMYYKPEGYREICNLVLTVDDALLNNYLNLKSTFETQSAETSEKTAEEATEATEAATEAATEEATEGTSEAEAYVTAEQVEEARLAVLASVADEVQSIKDRMAAGETFMDISTSYGFGYTYEAHNPSLMYEQPFIDAAFSVENIGDVSEPFVGSYGVYVVQYLSDVAAGPVELTPELYDFIYTELLSAAQNEAFTTTLENWMEEADIVYTDLGAAYRDAYVEEETEDEEIVIDLSEDTETTEEGAEEATETPAE